MSLPSLPQPLRRRTLITAAALGALGGPVGAQPAATDGAWPSLAPQIFSGRQLEDGSAMLVLDAPYRAEDAAIVPITIRVLGPARDRPRIRKITLVIDQNPSPLAAVFAVGANSGMRVLSTRVRIDSYTNLHVVAETEDGRLHATKRFVKAAGGCSAPASKAEDDTIPFGTMRLRQFAPAADSSPGLREAQLMIRHPNNSGMQMDQLTRLYVPAHFVTSARLWQGEELLLGVESGISIAENPEYRFNYRPNGATVFRAEAEDNRGGSFREEWPVTRA